MTEHIDLPVPQGNYLPAIRHGDKVYVSGMTPRRSGVLVFSGKISNSDNLEVHREAARLATSNAIMAAQSCLEEGEEIAQILQLTLFLNAESDFLHHAKIADYATELIIEALGPESIGSRAAVGVNSLPSNARLELTLVGAINKVTE